MTETPLTPAEALAVVIEQSMAPIDEAGMITPTAAPPSEEVEIAAATDDPTPPFPTNPDASPGWTEPENKEVAPA